MGLPRLQALPTKADVVDEYGELDRLIQAHKVIADRHELLKKTIKSWFDDHPADQPAVANGRQYTLQISARQVERTLAPARVWKLVGRDKFLSICQIAIGKLEELVGKGEVAKLAVEAQTGSRRIKAIAAAPATGPQAA